MAYRYRKMIDVCSEVAKNEGVKVDGGGATCALQVRPGDCNLSVMLRFALLAIVGRAACPWAEW